MKTKQQNSQYTAPLMSLLITLTVMILFNCSQKIFAQQWNTSGNDIYNSNSGKVGIGTPSPIYSLDVNGGLNSFRAKVSTVSAGDAIATFENSIVLLSQQPMQNKGEAAIPPPLTLRGIPSKQIMIGQQAMFLPDLALLDQDNHQVRFYSDLIKGRNVLITFFYTTCGSTCLRQGKVFSDLQNELGDRLGRDIFLISVTMDPERDTPQRLKTWGEQHGRRKGWTLVTGRTAEMEKLVGHLTGNPLGRLETHAPFIYLGNDKKNRWIATYSLSAPKNLMKQIEEL